MPNVHTLTLNSVCIEYNYDLLETKNDKVKSLLLYNMIGLDRSTLEALISDNFNNIKRIVVELGVDQSDFYDIEDEDILNQCFHILENLKVHFNCSIINTFDPKNLINKPTPATYPEFQDPAIRPFNPESMLDNKPQILTTNLNINTTSRSKPKIYH